MNIVAWMHMREIEGNFMSLKLPEVIGGSVGPPPRSNRSSRLCGQGDKRALWNVYMSMIEFGRDSYDRPCCVQAWAKRDKIGCLWIRFSFSFMFFLLLPYIYIQCLCCSCLYLWFIRILTVLTNMIIDIALPISSSSFLIISHHHQDNKQNGVL